MEEIAAPGLKWIKRANGKTPYWVAAELDVKNGYVPKTVNLRAVKDNPSMLKAKCDVLQAEMLLWRTGYRSEALNYNGTVKSLLKIYQHHEESPYQKLKPGSLVPYNHYLKNLEGHIGALRLDAINGVDIIRWHRLWSSNGKHLAAASFARSVFAAALWFGVINRCDGAAELLAIVRESSAKLPGPKARTTKMTAQQIAAARVAAHAAGRPSMALAYAIAFETVLRLWDVIGQWWPMDRGGVSDILNATAGTKWFGLRWDDIDDNLQLDYTPSKTSETSGKRVLYPLVDAPMVIEEFAYWPEHRRRGPIIVSEETGLPYEAREFRRLWDKDRATARIPSNVWARDLRASGITEGRASAAAVDDLGKVAGHTGRKMTDEVYDRAQIEAAGRVAKSRKEHRGRKDFLAPQ
ncbi:integrase [Rhizobium sp. SYY.PMSO]|uniref:integrase n=1 Tax=Rhizobium sp. SYY.PMSO TaxID=3382192 RepID=UPI0039902DBD